LQEQPVAELAREFAPWMDWSIAFILLSGALMFSSGALRYFDNTSFRVKMLLSFSALLFQFTAFRSVVRSEDSKISPLKGSLPASRHSYSGAVSDSLAAALDLLDSSSYHNAMFTSCLEEAKQHCYWSSVCNHTSPWRGPNGPARKEITWNFSLGTTSIRLDVPTLTASIRRCSAWLNTSTTQSVRALLKTS